MRVHFTECAVGALVLAICSSVATADPIRLLTEDRFVAAEALAFRPPGVVAVSSREQQVNADVLSASAQAAFDDTTTRAESQMASMLSPDLHHLSGVASTAANIIGPLGNGQATAIFEVWFELDASHAYDFEASFEALEFGSWQAHLRQSPGELRQSLLFSVISNTGPALQLSRRGSLDPGRYALTVRSDAGASTIFGVGNRGSANFDFAFDMAPVPEPSSMLLVGGGVLSIAARVRRRRRP